ncbi:hypothetical protein VTL71DRAFT_14689 [Oculimacula yallundae]|uniref:Heterokaryon incompatibility domain-containing protein n=1 Tax=Oculimacula yallundae TaxID=86028 RepID=A0ABR4CLG7_9HELO
MQDLNNALSQVEKLNLGQTGTERKNENDSTSLTVPLKAGFCSTCYLLDSCITNLEFFFANEMEMPAEYANTKDVQIGKRSEVEERAEVHGCIGCKSILKSFDCYLEHGSHSDEGYFPHPYIPPGLDYDLRLVMDPKNKANGWSSPLRITALKNSGLHLQATVRYSPCYQLGRVCDPHKLDYSVLKSWIACCEESHGHHCSVSPIADCLGPTHPVKYIDLEQSCLVDFPETPKYAALSYVWGGADTLMTTKNNLEELSQPGAFVIRTDQIPKTIQDAMALTRAMGVRYLWVDAVCIVQDDSEIKQDHLRAMPSIYAQAHFTIVVATGETANSGIPGVGPNSRPRHVPLSITLPTKAIGVNSLTHFKRLKFLTRMGFGPSRPIWSQRAWTMQEQMFSKRILLLGEVAAWLCSFTQYREEIVLLNEGLDWAKENKPNQKYNLFISTAVFLSRLAKLANEYNQRELSFEEDVVDAFLGITSLHTPIIGPMLFGMPESFFDHAMCWQISPTLRRRKATNPAAPPVPSWSWMGWHGELNFVLWEVFQDHILEIFGEMERIPTLGFDMHIQPLVKYYKTCLTCSDKFPIPNAYHDYRSANESNPEMEVPKGWTRTAAPSTWPESLPKAYYTRDAQPYVFLYRYPVIQTPSTTDHTCDSPLYSSTLSFRASHLKLTIAVPSTCTILPDFNRENHHITEAHILHPLTGYRIGSVHILDAVPLSSTPECSFIGISTGWCPARQVGTVFNKWEKTWCLGREHPFRLDVDEDFDQKEGLVEGWGGKGRFGFKLGFNLAYFWVNVLWVEWRNGVAYRKGLGRVERGAWERALEEVEVGEREVDVLLA